jgi:hypothetical protein
LQLWNLKGIGLEWKPLKAAAPQVVIEHIEQPSETWLPLFPDLQVSSKALDSSKLMSRGLTDGAARANLSADIQNW